jgi:hypothetical protein
MNHDPDRINTLERLPRSRSPERDLWPGIEARLAPRRARASPWRFALASGLVAGLAALATLGLRDAAPPADHAVAAAPAPGPTAVAALPLGADGRAIVRANLNMVRDAERQLRRALEDDPDSDALRSLLRSAEQRQRSLSAML